MHCLENIFLKCQTGVAALKGFPSIKPNVVKLMWKSPNYWVRLSCQRVISLIIRDAGVSSIDEGDSLKLMYRLLGCYKFVYVTEQLCALLQTNLLMVLKAVPKEDLVKVFKKSSYIGRRILGEKSN